MLRERLDSDPPNNFIVGNNAKGCFKKTKHIKFSQKRTFLTHQKWSVKKDVKLSFANFTEKHLRWSLFLIFADLKTCNFTKKDSNTNVFQQNLRNF